MTHVCVCVSVNTWALVSSAVARKHKKEEWLIPFHQVIARVKYGTDGRRTTAKTWGLKLEDGFDDEMFKSELLRAAALARSWLDSQTT